MHRRTEQHFAIRPRVVAALLALGSLLGSTGCAPVPETPGAPLEPLGRDRLSLVPVELVPQLSHTFEPYAGIVFSPDGSRVLAWGEYRPAVLWDTGTGAELRQFPNLDAFIFTPDGDGIVGIDDGVAVLFGARDGREEAEFSGHAGGIRSVAFSPDGDDFLTADAVDGSVSIWRGFGGPEVVRLSHPGASEAISSSAGLVLSVGSAEGSTPTARLWEVPAGRQIREFEIGEETPVFFVGDAGLLLWRREDRRLLLRDAVSGDLVWTSEPSPVTTRSFLASVALAGDYVVVNVSGFDERDFAAEDWGWVGSTMVLDADSGRRVASYPMKAVALDLSPDGRRLAAITVDSFIPTGSAHLMDPFTGETTSELRGGAPEVQKIVASPIGRHLFVMEYFGTQRGFRSTLWSLDTGEAIHIEGDHRFAGFSSDGAKLLTVERTDEDLITITVRDLRNGHKEDLGTFDDSIFTQLSALSEERGIASLFGFCPRLLDLRDQSVVPVAPDPAAGRVDETPCASSHLPPLPSEAVAAFSHALSVWDIRGGRFQAGVWDAFSPDGRWLLSGLPWKEDVRESRLIDATTGEEIRRFAGSTAIAFSPDGRRVTTSADGRLRLIDLETGDVVQHFDGAGRPAFLGRGGLIATEDQENGIGFWDVSSGSAIARAFTFQGGGWAVVDPEGRFDASDPDHLGGLVWVAGDEPIELSQLKDRFYDPGLLAKRLGFSDEPLRDVRGMESIALYPGFEVDPVSSSDPVLRVHLRNRGGGIGRVVIRVNGQEVVDDARPSDVDPWGSELLVETDLNSLPRLVPGEENTIEVQAFNAEGYLRSRTRSVPYTPVGDPLASTPKLWGIVAGVSDYQDPEEDELRDLAYASKDAAAIAAALEIAGERLYDSANVHIALLSTDEDSPDPTRENLIRAFEGARAAGPHDVLVVYLAGHGVTFGGAEGDYFFLTAGARTGNLTDPAIRQKSALSSLELTELLKTIPARKQVLILDTCASGLVVEQLTEQRDVPGDSVRRIAFERMKDRMGLHVLAASTADAGSYEASSYGQGLLTYALLEGMRGAALTEEDLVSVNPLFQYAADRVPDLAIGIGGIQRPTLASPTDARSVYIGRLLVDDRRRIELAQPQPRVTQSLFVEDGPIPRDPLRLSEAVDRVLRQRSAHGLRRRFVYVGVGKPLPGSYRISGRYRTDGQKLSAAAFVLQDDKEVIGFDVQGVDVSPELIAEEIVDRAENYLLSK